MIGKTWTWLSCIGRWMWMMMMVTVDCLRHFWTCSSYGEIGVAVTGLDGGIGCAGGLVTGWMGWGQLGQEVEVSRVVLASARAAREMAMSARATLWSAWRWVWQLFLWLQRQTNIWVTVGQFLSTLAAFLVAALGQSRCHSWEIFFQDVKLWKLEILFSVWFGR